MKRPAPPRPSASSLFQVALISRFSLSCQRTSPTPSGPSYASLCTTDIVLRSRMCITVRPSSVTAMPAKYLPSGEIVRPRYLGLEMMSVSF